jgi:hypothetical protein
MAATIPDLWPTSALKIDILTPIAILRSQATRLSQKTQGLLVAETTVTTGSNNQIMLGLEVVAPALNNHRQRLLSVQYTKDEIYPARVSARGFRITETTRSTSLLSADKTITKSVDEKTAYSDNEFIKIVQEALQAPETVALLQSLIARSNEATSDSPPTDEEDENMGQNEAQAQ